MLKIKYLSVNKLLSSDFKLDSVACTLTEQLRRVEKEEKYMRQSTVRCQIFESNKK